MMGGGASGYSPGILNSVLNEESAFGFGGGCLVEFPNGLG